MPMRPHIPSLALGIVATVFVLHAWQLYSMRSLALQALQQSQVNAENITQLANYLGSKVENTVPVKK
jgi:hypothetical protein